MIIGIKPITMNGSDKIPNKFKLLGGSISVTVNNNYCNANKCYGEANLIKKKIVLCDKYAERKLTVRFKEITFYHELVHMILDSMGNDVLCNNEDFVQLFAERLYEYEKSKQ